MRILLVGDATDGGNPQTAAQINQPQTGQVDLPPPGQSLPAPPPAAKIVVTGGIDERTVELQEQLDEARAVIARTEAEKKDREQTICELQDKLHAAKFPARAPAPSRSALERFMDGEDV